jgi:3-oxoacyl-[acyl-carrier-protein] synthase III
MKVKDMASDTVLDIIGQGAWQGGRVVDNSIFEGIGMYFKGDKPVNDAAIQQRVGVRTRYAAGADERIGVASMQNLLKTVPFDRSRIRLVIGATNVGEDKWDPGPLVQYSYELIREACPEAMVLDVYAGCPGFNVSMELILNLSLAGMLEEGDVSIIVGAENIHRAHPFPDLDTSNVIFGDDALSTAFETKATARPSGRHTCSEPVTADVSQDLLSGIARLLLKAVGDDRLDGLLIDNHIARLDFRVPASAARVQHQYISLKYPEEAKKGTFDRFRDALEFYDTHVNAFAFDINSLKKSPDLVNRLAQAYVESGRYRTVAAVYLDGDFQAALTVHRGEGFAFERPRRGIVDAVTRTHGCFGDYIYGRYENDDLLGSMDGKGVFLYATRGARKVWSDLLSRNARTVKDIDLLIEHQANFAMIPLTMAQVLNNGQPDIQKDVVDFVANRMVTNIHERGNCSVVCMQRLPYDLMRGALKPDAIQGIPINRNLEALKQAKTILYDSVGAGMTRSAVLRLI